MTAFRPRARRCVLAVSSLAALALLNGCATLGGNVKGSFSCQAPNGICAPSSTIDDRALAMISGDAGDMTIPAGPYVPPPPPRSTLASARATLPLPGARRSSERVLRVVFQPYIDQAGRLHEASAIRTVVQGEWQATDAMLPPAPVSGQEPVGASLADAVDRAETHGVRAADPDLPDPAVVAAARARRSDPIAEIRADVAARLTAPRGRAPATRVPAIRAARRVGITRAPAPAPVVVPRSIASQPQTPSAAATSRVARSAGAPAAAPALRATSFPGVTSEEN